MQPEQIGDDMTAWAVGVRGEQERARAAANPWSEAFHAGMLLVLGWYGDLLAGRTTRYGADGQLQTGVLAPAEAPEPEPAVPREPGTHLGTVGERAEFVLTVTSVVPEPTIYGERTAYGLRDADGNDALWLHSSGPGRLEEGRTYRLRATVKEHGEHEGRNQTVLTRCKVVETGAPEEPPPSPGADPEPVPSQAFLFAGAIRARRRT